MASIHLVYDREHIACEICSRSFTRFSTLRSHMLKFHPNQVSPREPVFTCKNCSRSFVKSNVLVNHRCF